MNFFTARRGLEKGCGMALAKFPVGKDQRIEIFSCTGHRIRVGKNSARNAWYLGGLVRGQPHLEFFGNMTFRMAKMNLFCIEEAGSFAATILAK